jgi:hypothetical protein
LEDLVAEELKKEAKIRKRWEKIDREAVFRGYCNPGDKVISQNNLGKYFTVRECKILMDRLDPTKSG